MLDEPASHIVHLAEQRGQIYLHRRYTRAGLLQRLLGLSVSDKVEHKSATSWSFTGRCLTRDCRRRCATTTPCMSSSSGRCRSARGDLRPAPSPRSGCGSSCSRPSLNSVPSACRSRAFRREHGPSVRSREARPRGGATPCAWPRRLVDTERRIAYTARRCSCLLHSAPRLWRRTTRCSRRCADVPRLSGYREASSAFSGRSRAVVGRVAFAVLAWRRLEPSALRARAHDGELDRRTTDQGRRALLVTPEVEPLHLFGHEASKAVRHPRPARDRHPYECSRDGGAGR